VRHAITHDDHSAEFHYDQYVVELNHDLGPGQPEEVHFVRVWAREHGVDRVTCGDCRSLGIRYCSGEKVVRVLRKAGLLPREGRWTG
jgi:hypothetical protein